MGLINTSVPNLTQGVSQQPTNLRFSGQAETQVNALSSVIEGLTKRPNTRILKELKAGLLSPNTFVDIIDRGSETERYLVVVEPQVNTSLGGTVQMWKIDEENNTYNSISITNGATNQYLQTSNPRKDLKIVTIADTTFILNRSKEVTEDTNNALTKPAFAHEALVFVKQAAKGKEYKISLGKGSSGVTYAYSPNEDELVKSNRILPVLKYGNNVQQGYDLVSGQQFSPNFDPNKETFEKNGTETSDGIGEFNSGGYTIESHIFGNVMRLRLKQTGTTVNQPFTGAHELSVSDDLNDQGLGLAYKEVSSITDLPAKAFEDFEIKVKGDTEIGEDDYYVKFVTKNGEDFGEGSWVETTGFQANSDPDGTRTFESDGQNLHLRIDTATFPLKLVPETTGSNYKLLQCVLDHRTVGDDNTNPFPSFVRQKINDIFFFKNRLGVLTKDNVVMSEARNFFNFFRTTTTSLLDSALIDVSVAHPNVSDLQAAVAFQEKLLLMSPTAQFILRGNDILTPSTVNINPATQFTSDSTIDPLSLGGFVYFPFSRGDYQGIREFTIDDLSSTYDAFEITEHVPKYIPADIREMRGSTAENIIVCTSSADQQDLYVYKYFRKNKEKLQSSWSKFRFRNQIIGCNFIDSKLYIVQSEYVVSSGTRRSFLSVIPFESGLTESSITTNHAILLDNRIEYGIGSSDVSYDSGTKESTISNISYDPMGDTVVYTEDGTRYETTKVNGTTVKVSGANFAGHRLYLGHEYEMEYEFSTLPLKQPSERGGRSISDFVHQIIRNLAVEYSDTGFFSIEVTPEYSDTFTYSFNSTQLGADFKIGKIALDSGMFRVPVHAQPDKVKIKIKSSSALPAKLLSAEFESFIAPRSRRYGSG